jgi:hypothetical protein
MTNFPIGFILIETLPGAEAAFKLVSEAHQGFFYRPKVADISEISFLSPGSDKI